MPRFPGDTEFRGTILHSAQYRNPAQFRNQTALVVGAGNSGAEIAAELAAAGAEVSISIRNGAVIQPLMLLGIPTQYWGILLHGLPSPMATAVMSGFRSLQSGRQRHIALIPQRMGQLPAGRVPIIGDRLLEAVKCGKVRVRSGIERFTADAVVFSGGGMEAYSHVILATGYRPAHNFLENLDAQRTPGLFVVGLNNSLAGTLWHIRHEAQRIPLSIRAYLR